MVVILCQGVLNFINDQLESCFLLLSWGLMGLQHRLLWDFKDLFLLNVLLLLGLQHRLIWDFKDLFLLNVLVIQLDQNAILY